MFAKIFALFAVLAVAFAAPNPNPNPKAEPSPQLLAYTSGFDYAYPAVAAVPSVVSPYSAAPVYSPYAAYPAAYYVR